MVDMQTCEVCGKYLDKCSCEPGLRILPACGEDVYLRALRELCQAARPARKAPGYYSPSPNDLLYLHALGVKWDC